MKRIRFYVAMTAAKIALAGLKLLGRNATYLPGKIALKIDKKFLGGLKQPKTVIAVTGTNGKTTTTRLVNSIIGTTYSCDMFGNIGKPLTLGYSEDLDYMVCEVSSFQLETTYMFKQQPIR